MPLKIGSPLPKISVEVEWIVGASSEIYALSDSSKATFIHFWAKSCPACKANMPHLQPLRDWYGPMNLQTIAVHLPRGPFDLERERVRDAVEKLGIREPCAVDNEHVIGNLFEVRAWPTYYLFDNQHKVKRHAMGGFGVRMIEAALKDMFDQ